MIPYDTSSMIRDTVEGDTLIRDRSLEVARPVDGENNNQMALRLLPKSKQTFRGDESDILRPEKHREEN